MVCDVIKRWLATPAFQWSQQKRGFFIFFLHSDEVCFLIRRTKKKWNGRDLIQRIERSLIPPESCCSEVRSVQTFYKRGNLFFFIFLKAAPFLIYASLKQFCKFLHKWALTYTSPRTVSPQLCCNSTKLKTLFYFLQSTASTQLNTKGADCIMFYSSGKFCG